MRATRNLLQFLLIVSLSGLTLQQSYGNMMAKLPQLLKDSQLPVQSDAVPNYSQLQEEYNSLLSQLVNMDKQVLNDELQAAAAAAAADGGNISKTCLKHLDMTWHGLRQRQAWTLRMLDSAGKLQSGLLNGNIYWLGSYDECVNITATVFTGPNFTMPTHPFKGRYCKVGIPLGHSPPKIVMTTGAVFVGLLNIGLCVPNSCSANDVKFMLNFVFDYIPRCTNISLQVSKALCNFDELEYDDRAIFAIVLLSLFAGMIVVGTAYDIFIIHKLHIDTDSEPDSGETAPLISSPSEESNDTSKNIKYRGRYCSGNQPAGLLEGEQPNSNIQEPPEICIGTLGKIMQVFSVYTNSMKLLSTKTQSGMLGAVNGIRFFSMAWVILGHSYVFALYEMSNALGFIAEKMSSLSFMFMVNGTLAVDSFFTISGLLVAYLSLRELKKVGGVKNFNWGMFYFHRFWRLTPPYMLVMLLYIPLLKYWYNGPFWPQNGIERNYCENSWWKNLLYIQNFFKVENMCMAWSWYLANDMQFYVISPLLLIPLYYSSILGGVVCFMMLLVCWISSGVISSINNLPMTFFGGGGDMTKAPESLDWLYMRPYTRIGPYVVGMLFGYLLYKMDCKIRMPRIINAIGWILTAVGCLSVLYGNYGTISGKDVSSKEIIALYTAVSRSVWGFGVAWIIFACATGHGGIVNTFLSCKMLIPLSRLTYVAYLIHPVIMMVYYGGKRNPIYLNDFEAVYYYVAHLFVSYVLAFVLSLAFESPFMGLEKAIFSRERKH